MWGQQQSAMITEGMFLNLGPQGGLLNAGIPESISVLEKGSYANYMPEESIAAWQNNGTKLFDQTFAKKTFNEMEAFLHSF